MINNQKENNIKLFKDLRKIYKEVELDIDRGNFKFINLKNCTFYELQELKKVFGVVIDIF